MREICLDTETTGLDPVTGHRIIEIACVELHHKLRTNNTFHTYINPRREVPEEAFRIHGISTQFLTDKPIFEHVAVKFLQFIKGARLVIHNASFDLKFLNHELMLAGLPVLKAGENIEDVVDSLTLARGKFPGASNSLDGLCRRFKIDLSRRVKHGALLDCELLADVYLELTGGAQTTMILGELNKEKEVFYEAKSSAAGDGTTQEQTTTDSGLNTFPNRKITPSNQNDLDAHRDFILNNFKSNFWGY